MPQQQARFVRVTNVINQQAVTINVTAIVMIRQAVGDQKARVRVQGMNNDAAVDPHDYVRLRVALRHREITSELTYYDIPGKAGDVAWIIPEQIAYYECKGEECLVTFKGCKERWLALTRDLERCLAPYMWPS